MAGLNPRDRRWPVLRRYGYVVACLIGLAVGLSIGLALSALALDPIGLPAASPLLWTRPPNSEGAADEVVAPPEAHQQAEKRVEQYKQQLAAAHQQAEHQAKHHKQQLAAAHQQAEHQAQHYKQQLAEAHQQAEKRAQHHKQQLAEAHQQAAAAGTQAEQQLPRQQRSRGQEQQRVRTKPLNLAELPSPVPIPLSRSGADRDVRILVHYVYFEGRNVPHCELRNKRLNLATFLAGAVATAGDNVQFVFTIPGTLPGADEFYQSIGKSIPRPKTIFPVASNVLVRKPGLPLLGELRPRATPDLCHHAEYFAAIGTLNRWHHDYVVFTNDGMRGPRYCHYRSARKRQVGITSPIP